MAPQPFQDYLGPLHALVASIARMLPQAPLEPAGAQAERASWTTWAKWTMKPPDFADRLRRRLGWGWGVLAVATEDREALQEARDTAQELGADFWVSFSVVV